MECDGPRHGATSRSTGRLWAQAVESGGDESGHFWSTFVRHRWVVPDLASKAGMPITGSIAGATHAEKAKQTLEATGALLTNDGDISVSKDAEAE